jgi:hypothetical protein
MIILRLLVGTILYWKERLFDEHDDGEGWVNAKTRKD